jgi:hypothetical protein
MRLPLRNHPVLALVLLGILIRAGLVLCVHSPARYDDTQGYVDLARMLVSGDFTGYDGFRTPMYSLLWIVCGGNPTALFIVQMTLGLWIAVILYEVFMLLSGSRGVAFAAGLTYHLNVSALLFESNLLTETSTIFLVATSLWLTFRFTAAWRDGRRPWGLAFGAGWAAALAALDRPLCAVLPGILLMLVAAWLLRARATDRKTLALSAAAFAAPVLLLLGGWSYFNYRTTGYFALSTLTGDNLSHWSGAYIESAPAEYDVIKKTYIPYRNRSGTSHQTIWQAEAELQQRTGLTAAQLSDRLKGMSIAIIRAHPADYLAATLRAWVDFWKPSLIRQGVDFPPWPWWIFRLAFAALEVLFLLAPAAWLLSGRFRSVVARPYEFLLLYALVHLTALVQALLITVENPRYSVPVDPWTLGTATVVVYVARRMRRTRTLAAPNRARAA